MRSGADRGERGRILLPLVLARAVVPGVGARLVEPLEELHGGALRCSSRVGHRLACSALRPSPDELRLEAVLEQEQVEVAPRAVEHAAGRQRARSADPRRLRGDQPCRACDRHTAFGGQLTRALLGLVQALADVGQPAVDRALRDAHAAHRVQAQLVGALGVERAERRLEDAIGDPRPGRCRAYAVAGDVWLSQQLVLVAEERQHGRVVEVHQVALRGAQPGCSIPAAVDLQARARIHVGQAARAVGSLATTNARWTPPAPEQNVLVPAAAVHHRPRARSTRALPRPPTGSAPQTPSRIRPSATSLNSRSRSSPGAARETRSTPLKSRRGCARWRRPRARRRARVRSRGRACSEFDPRRAG